MWAALGGSTMKASCASACEYCVQGLCFQLLLPHLISFYTQIASS